MEAVGRLMKGDQVLSHPDHVARAAYEARMEQTIALADEELDAPAPDAPAPDAPAPELEKEAV
jgi:hypothetical protein